MKTKTVSSPRRFLAWRSLSRMAAVLALGGFIGGGLGASTLLAQDDNSSRRMPENLTPEQMRARMLERVRERLGVKDDAEWQVISQRISQVLEARRALGGGGGPGGFGGPPGGPGGPGGDPQRRDSANSAGPGGNDGPGGPGGQGGPPPDNAGGSGGPGGRGGPGDFNRQSDPEMEALRKAIEANAPAAELKTKMEQLRAARAQKEATLEKAQTELRQVLTTRQEALAVSMGWLK